MTPSGCGGKTLGPPSFFESSPDADSPTSRTISASRRKRFWRARSLLYGSAASSSARATEDWRYVAEVTIRRWIAFWLQGTPLGTPASPPALAFFADDGEGRANADVGVPGAGVF